MLTAARLLTGSSHLAEDLVQEAYARTYLRWAQLRDEQPYAYARRIMLNRYLDWWRRPRREFAVESFGERIVTEDQAEGVAVTQQLVRALGELTRRERTVLVLRYFEDASEREIAEALGIARGTVKSTANRALGKLRASGHFDLDPKEGDHGASTA